MQTWVDSSKSCKWFNYHTFKAYKHTSTFTFLQLWQCRHTSETRVPFHSWIIIWKVFFTFFWFRWVFNCAKNFTKPCAFLLLHASISFPWNLYKSNLMRLYYVSAVYTSILFVLISQNSEIIRKLLGELHASYSE